MSDLVTSFYVNSKEADKSSFFYQVSVRIITFFCIIISIKVRMKKIVSRKNCNSNN